MPPFGPISRANLIRALHALGFVGPFPGGRHAFMVRGERDLPSQINIQEWLALIC